MRPATWAQAWALLSLLCGALTSAAGHPWQVTLRYGPEGLTLVKAVPLAAAARNARTPGLEGAPVKLACELEWLDAAGLTLGRVAAVIPLGQRSPLLDGATASGLGAQIPPSGVVVFRAPGPEVPAAVRGLRLLSQGPAVADDLAPRASELPAGFAAGVHTFWLPGSDRTKTAGVPVPGWVGSDKVRSSGPDTNRLVLVAMGDGYTAADLAAGVFSNQVARFFEHLFAAPPWSAYSNAINLYLVNLASPESGADYEDASPAAGGTLKETCLDARFWAGGVERCLYLGGDGVGRAIAAADAAAGAGLWDEILVFVNSPKYGGCGGTLGVSSAHPLSDEIQTHEFGHAFAGLADEYDYGGSGTNCLRSAAPNVACIGDGSELKWAAWVRPGTPIPTPETAAYAGAVGAFEGALYQAAGVYRPMLECKMKSLGRPFCAVCAEAHVLKLFDRISLIEEARPAPGPIEVLTNAPRLFAVSAPAIPGLSYRWWLDDVELPGETNAFLSISNVSLASATRELRVTATHSTALVRRQPVQASCVWQLLPADLPTLVARDAVVTEGDGEPAALDLVVELSSPSADPVEVDYASADGTAVGAADFLPVSGRLVFQPGETRKMVSLSVTGDLEAEPDEVFQVRFGNPAQAALAAPDLTVTIRDNDALPRILLASPTNGMAVREGETVRLSADLSASPSPIARVELFKDGAREFELTAPPFETNWLAGSRGRCVWLAVATDPLGRGATSAPVTLELLAPGPQPIALVALTNAWRYDASTNDYGASWTDPAFGESLWRGPSNALFFTGNLPLGGPKKTALPLTQNGVRIRAFYFRTRFTWSGVAPSGVRLVASNLVDDGAVFYLNGVEAGRLRMPEGAVTRATFALPGGYATKFDTLDLATNGLAPGDNVLAVAVHLASETSTMAAFGMSLHAVPANQPPSLEPTPDATVNEGARFSVQLTVADPDGNGQAPVFSLEPDAPAGAAVSPQGWFEWTPPLGWLPATNRIVVRATDLGTPPLSVTQTFAVVVNHLPTPASPALERHAQGGLRVRALALLGTDADGDALHLGAVPAWSAQGGSVSTDLGWVIYTPPPGLPQPDAFDYVVGDGRGGFSAGVVTIGVATNAPPSIGVAWSQTGDGQVRLRCRGIPGLGYTVEYAETLTPPFWQPLTLIEPDPLGELEFVDRPPPGAPARFYRIVCP